jgi:hypothetical protein
MFFAMYGFTIWPAGLWEGWIMGLWHICEQMARLFFRDSGVPYYVVVGKRNGSHNYHGNIYE